MGTHCTPLCHLSPLWASSDSSVTGLVAHGATAEPHNGASPARVCLLCTWTAWEVSLSALETYPLLFLSVWQYICWVNEKKHTSFGNESHWEFGLTWFNELILEQAWFFVMCSQSICLIILECCWMTLSLHAKNCILLFLKIKTFFSLWLIIPSSLTHPTSSISSGHSGSAGGLFLSGSSVVKHNHNETTANTESCYSWRAGSIPETVLTPLYVPFTYHSFKP